MEEKENNNLALQQACTKLELADSKLDDRDRDMAELQQKVLVKQPPFLVSSRPAASAKDQRTSKGIKEGGHVIVARVV